MDGPFSERLSRSKRADSRHWEVEIGHWLPMEKSISHWLPTSWFGSIGHKSRRLVAVNVAFGLYAESRIDGEGEDQKSRNSDVACLWLYQTEDCSVSDGEMTKIRTGFTA